MGHVHVAADLTGLADVRLSLGDDEVVRLVPTEGCAMRPAAVVY